MELTEAISSAEQILDEERLHPTVDYECLPQGGNNAAQALTAIAGIIGLQTQRSHRPRQIIEQPTWYKFKSTNHTLLCAILSRLTVNNRAAFLSWVASRIVVVPGSPRKDWAVGYPGWNNITSELPLVAEFLVRCGGKPQFLRVLSEAALIPEHAPLLRQVEEIVALNYTTFSSSEYETLSFAARFIASRESARVEEYRKQNAQEVMWPGVGVEYTLRLCQEVQASASAIVEQCRKARYLYLRGSLLEGLNLEVNQDKTTVEEYIQRYGFPSTLIESLNEAERFYLHGTTPLDFKSSMGHLRSFLESVHREAMPALHTRLGGILPNRWGSGLEYLEQKNVLSKAEAKFVSGLYSIISNEGVHPLVAEKEYARLARNFAIEYALLFFRKVEKLGASAALAAHP